MLFLCSFSGGGSLSLLLFFFSLDLSLSLGFLGCGLFFSFFLNFQAALLLFLSLQPCSSLFSCLSFFLFLSNSLLFECFLARLFFLFLNLSQSLNLCGSGSFFLQSFSFSFSSGFFLSLFSGSLCLFMLYALTFLFLLLMSQAFSFSGFLF